MLEGRIAVLLGELEGASRALLHLVRRHAGTVENVIRKHALRRAFNLIFHLALHLQVRALLM